MADPVEQPVTDLGDEENKAPIEKVLEEHPDVSPGIAIAQEKEEVESADSFTSLVDRMFDTPEETADNPEATKSEDHAYMRDVAFVQGTDEVELDPNNEFEKAEDAKQRVEEVQMVNEELKATGSQRRYVVNRNDAPERAYVHEDGFGKYYYAAVDKTIRPSDVAKYAGVEVWEVLDKDDKIIKTVELLNEFTGEPLADADSVEAAKSWIQRNTERPETDAKSQDVFPPEVLDNVAKMVALAEAGTGNVQRDGST